MSDLQNPRAFPSLKKAAVETLRDGLETRVTATLSPIQLSSPQKGSWFSNVTNSAETKQMGRG